MIVTVRRWSDRIVGGALHLAPEWFRDTLGRDVLLTHGERTHECTSVLSLVRVTAIETASIIVLALRLHLAPPPSAVSMAHEQYRRPRLPFMDTLRQDIAFAFRSFSRRPAFTLLVVATFGLGIAATTAMYSAVDAVLLRPINAPNAEQIASIYPTYPDWRSNERLAAWWDRGTFTWPAYIEYGRTQRSFSAIAGYTWSSGTLTSGGMPEQVGIGLATPELFGILGARPYAGRLFAPGDPADVVLLAHNFWRARFGSDAGVIGRRIGLGTRRYTVIGVLPPRFEMTRFWHGPGVIDAPIWRLIVPDGSGNYGPNNGFLTVMGRLAPGVTFERANAEATQLIPALMTRPDLKVGGRVVERIADQTMTYREPLLILIGASVVLLIAACTSVAAMLLGAGIDREGELEVRAALGAGRSRLARQLVTEGVFIGLVGGVLGIVLSAPLLRLLVLIAPTRMPGLANASIDARVLSVALGVSILFALAFSIAPTLVLSRANLARGSSSRVVGGRRGRLQSALVIGELALATVLLLGAGLLTKTMRRLETVDPGFVPEGLLTARVNPSFTRFNVPGDDDNAREARIAAYYGQMADALRALPGVQSVAIAGVTPFSGDAGSNEVQPEGVTPKPGEVLDAERRPVTSNYFETMRMRIVAGRGFTPDDDRADAQRVVVVNEEMVRRYWPGETGVGKRLGFWKNQWTVVGVVRDTRESNLRGDRSTKFYVPSRRLNSAGGSFVIRTRGDEASVLRAITPALHSVDPTVAVTQVATMRARMGETVVEQRYRMRLMIAFSVLAVVFAVAGVYGVLSRSVARRKKELGIRTALGAVRRDVIVMLLEQGLRLGAAGLVVGLVIGYFGTKVLESMLYDTQRTDPLTIVAIATLVLGLAVVAAWRPARRAADVAPMEVLRGD